MQKMKTMITQFSSIYKWRNYASMLKLPSFLATLCCIIFSISSYAQYNCTSNDVRIVRAFLSTTTGGEIECEAGDEINADLHLIVSTKTGRTGVYLSADIWVDGVYYSTIANCFGVLLTGTNNDLKTTISDFPCPIGKTIELRNVFVAWGTGKDNFCPNTEPETPSKCRYKEGEVIIVELLGSGFSFLQGECTGNNREVEFTGNASGGTGPYKYEWFLNDEVVPFRTTNTADLTDVFTRSFISGIDYEITLKVTDDAGAEKITTHTVPVVSCCRLEITCPLIANSDLGIFNCNNLNTIPATTGTLANLTAWYGIQVGTNPCGNINWNASDDATQNVCSSSDQIITRTVTIWDDLNGNNTLDADDEESATCTFTYTLQRDNAAPTLKASSTLPGGAQGNVCKADAPAAPSLSSIAALYEDNCSTVTATLTSSNVTGNNCSWTATYVYSVKDACLNATTATVIYTGGDTEKPVITLSNCNTTNLGWNPTTAQINAAFGTVSSVTDNCGTPTLVSIVTPPAEENGCLRTQTRTWTYMDGCNNRETASCTVSWYVSPRNSCYTADLVERQYNSSNNTTSFRFKVCAISNCAALSYVAFIPHSTSASNVVPVQTSSRYSTVSGKVIYTSCNGRTYGVERPVSKNVNGIKYNTLTEGIKNGSCDDFEFVLTGNHTNTNFTVETKGGKDKASTISVNANCATSPSASSSCPVTSTRSTDAPVLEQAAALTLKAFPNPYSDNIRFTVNSPLSGQGSLEVFNVLGQKVKTVFQGNFVAGTQSFELNVPSAHRSTLIYVLRVGDKQITGKILNANRQ
jgi:hypothetical protein